jgi:TonB family protein
MTKSKKILALMAFATFTLGSASVFCQTDDKTVVQDSIEEEEDEYIVFGGIVECMPEFPLEEGADAYIMNRIRYPEAAIEAKVEGLVSLTFIVDKDGSVTNIKVLKDIGYGCGDEVVRILKEMPKWIPCTQRGKPVRFKYGKNIRFTLPKEE